LPAQSVRGGITPLRKTRRPNRISLILGNIAVFVRGILFIEKYDRLRDFTGEGFSAFSPKQF
jgi:hypothetical protein